MSRRLRIVIVSYIDDNFGDNLIRTSFEALLDVALANHGLTHDDYETSRMALKNVDEDLLAGADAIYFAGGGLFGLSYLNFFDHLERITAIAEHHEVPVIFSSMGLNNMGAEDGRVDAISDILKKSCVRALSVRENLPLFEKVVTGAPFEAQQVADPAVWTKYVYGLTDVVPDGALGINVVRGGLFAANQRRWGLTAEMNYLLGLLQTAQAADWRTRLYTNGSLDDNNTLRFFAREHDVVSDQVILPQTTREVVEAIASCSAIASIRMHSSIIAYSFDIPTIALAWNDKLPHFYEAIGHPDRVIPFGEWSPERSFQALQRAGLAPERGPGYQEYLMSTYRYIHGTVGDHVLKNHTGGTAAYEFSTVADALVRRSHRIDEDEFDLRVKMGKVERAYLQRFISIREKDKKIASLAKRAAKLSEKSDASEKSVREARAEIAALEERVREQQRQLDARLTRRVVRRVQRISRRLRIGVKR